MIYCEVNWDYLALIPSLDLMALRDDESDDAQGIAVAVGWLFWEITLLVEL